MKKKIDIKKTKQNKYNLARVFLILLILAVIIAIANNAFFQEPELQCVGVEQKNLADLI